MTGKDQTSVVFRFGTKQIHFTADASSYQKFKSLCLVEGITIQDALAAFIKQKVDKFDGGPKLDNFFDEEFIETPKIDAEFDNHIEWLKRQKDDVIEISKDKFYKLHILSKALLDSPNKRNFDLSYEAAWRRYR